MRVKFGNRDSGFGRIMRAVVRPVEPSKDTIALSRWTPTQSGIYVRRTVSRRDFAKIAAASVMTAPLFNAGCDDPEFWTWLLDVLQETIKLIDAAIGKYETRNTGESKTDVEITTSAKQEVTEATVDQVTQIANVPADGKTYEILTPDAQNGGLIAPEPGNYFLEGSIPAASALVKSSTYLVTA